MNILYKYILHKKQVDGSTKLLKLPCRQRLSVAHSAANNQRRTTMESGTKDKVKGTFREAKGKIKEVAGKVSGQPDLEAAGTDEKLAGKIQKKIGQIKTVLGK